MRRLACAAITLCCVAVDQLVKYWAKVDLALRPGSTIPIIQDVFHLTYVENLGAAFGILQNQRWLFLALTFLVVLAIIYVLFIRKPAPGRLPSTALAFILGGAIGNLIDRVMNGYVVDMFDARIIGFAVFNVADACLVCAVIVLAVWMLWGELHKKKQTGYTDGAGDK